MIQQLVTEYPLLVDIIATKPTLWLNQKIQPFTNVKSRLKFNYKDIQDASDRLERFRPYIEQVFPETVPSRGQIESPLVRIPAMHKKMDKLYQLDIPGTLLVKLDSHLPISGSIKARGGIYEVLKFAETIAINHGLLKITDNYSLIDSAKFQKLFNRFSVIVGSTGNLGLSIGIISAKLGFRSTVHMSVDAKQWKKEMLRAKGVTVVEHQADYSLAVAEGREQAMTDPLCHFVDDESSKDLFLGYSVAAERLKTQLFKQSVRVDDSHPLCVYLPCGVGGGPGGVTFGLKFAFGDNVHCFFAEPTQSPAMMVGLSTGLHDSISSQDLGIQNKTIADGLAVSRPSGLVSHIMEHILSGIFTVKDNEMYRLLAVLAKCENIRLEPSAVAGFSGVPRIVELWERLGIAADPKNATHLVWATGGNMVPDNIWEKYHIQGVNLLRKKGVLKEI
jgi:D-serine dehydratase